MTAVLLSLLTALLSTYWAFTNSLTTGWTVFSGVAGYIVGSLLVGLVIRRKLGRIQKDLQEMMQAAQGRITRQVQQAQRKPGTSPVALQRQIDLQQTEVLKRALQHTERLEPYRKWAPTLARQISTMRLQFLYQLKRFDEVDEILSMRNVFRKPLLMEPTLVAMKMARAYKRDDLDAMEATFRKHIRWMRGDRGSLLYGTMAWAWVKKGEIEKAHELLTKAKDRTGNETLTRNWEHLANDRVKKFSNTGLGEAWYALHLEGQPKPKMQRARGRNTPTY
jgi:hypothetical protein